MMVCVNYKSGFDNAAKGKSIYPIDAFIPGIIDHIVFVFDKIYFGCSMKPDDVPSPPPGSTFFIAHTNFENAKERSSEIVHFGYFGSFLTL